jgi:uncharacterized membrane protein YgaE (UPF0421/DUF939 family)
MRVDRVRTAWLAIIQTGVAAGVAWALARLIVGQPAPFFAPAAAVITLGLARGQTRSRSVELTVGVAIGLGIADIVRHLVGVGPIQIGAVVSLTVAAALLVGAGMVLVNQSVITAVLVMALPTSGQGAAPDRFFDAVIGSAVALAFSQLVLHRDPARIVGRAIEPTLTEFASALRAVGDALSLERLPLALDGLNRMRGLDPRIAALYDSLAMAREASLLSPARRRVRGQLEPYDDAARHIDYAVRNSRVLARNAATAVRTHVAVSTDLIGAIEGLAAVVDALEHQLAGNGDANDTQRLAVEAAAKATGVLEHHHDLRSSVLIGQVRATAVDLLRASGLDAASARTAIGEAPQVEDL